MYFGFVAPLNAAQERLFLQDALVTLEWGCSPAGGHFAPAGEIHAPALRYASEMRRTRDRLLAPAPLPTVPALSLHCPELHMYKKLLHHRMQQLFMLI